MGCARYDELLAERMQRSDWRFHVEEFTGSLAVLSRKAGALWDDAYPAINKTDEDGADALHYACRDGKIPLVQVSRPLLPLPLSLSLSLSVRSARWWGLSRLLNHKRSCQHSRNG